MRLQPLSLPVMFFADEREAVQKKTFTKWVNSHLGRVTCRIGDLYTDLRDGRMLIRLLEVLSGEQLVSITQKAPFFVLTMTQALSMTLTLHHKSGGRGNHALHFFFLSVGFTSFTSTYFFFSFLISANLSSSCVLCSHKLSDFNRGFLSFSSASHSQSPLRAACVSTAWRMLTKPCSFSRSKKSI